MTFDIKCPFHTFSLGVAVTAATVALWQLGKRRTRIPKELQGAGLDSELSLATQVHTGQ